MVFLRPRRACSASLGAKVLEKPGFFPRESFTVPRLKRPPKPIRIEAEPWLRIPMQTVLLSDDDGSKSVILSPAEIRAWVRYANRAFAPGRIRFEWNPTTDLTRLRSTRLNQEELPGGDGRAIAGNYPGKVVVFFRGRTGRGYSWPTLPYVVMPPLYGTRGVCGHANIGLLAHELGHYLGLPHTFPGDGSNPATAARFFRQHGNFDGDGIPDTADDPSIALYLQCSFQKRAVLPFKYEGKTFWPPRDNVMSYYSWPTGSQYQQTFSPLQFSRMREIVAKRGLIVSAGVPPGAPVQRPPSLPSRRPPTCPRGTFPMSPALLEAGCPKGETLKPMLTQPGCYLCVSEPRIAPPPKQPKRPRRPVQPRFRLGP